MEKKAEWEIPLKITLNFDDVEDLEALKGSEEFLDLIYKAVVAALKQAIRKNKSECVLFNIVNLDLKIKIKKNQYKELLNNCIIYYEKLEDYTTCQELVELKQRF